MSVTETIPDIADGLTYAGRFVNSTSNHIFLTGKAGTGKTTFLRNLSSLTHKQFAIVAPTGIAALNAGGVTIHSLFLLPFGMFVPGHDISGEGNFYSSDTLARKHPINSVRKQVLRSIDLLVIDEVSMLRADLLDAIDYRLKAARGNFRQSFGGVQLLLIGDLYQLPPVVKREEDMYLRRHYRSPWFFESKALQQDGFVYIELDKIFRQRDNVFIDLLNNLRNNQVTAADITLLNKYYQPAEEIAETKDVITLTTHNHKADDLNQRALKALDSPSHILHAKIEGDFPENIHPVQQYLELKEGAQIMFTKNDNADKIYFNGKLGTVTKIDGDSVTVELAGSKKEYILKKEVWENKRYRINASTQEMEDEVIGTFEQYPVKLAWAITVHKSQGLTFENAIIDVGQAFADGQVYVALSRLRSIDGLILRSPISQEVIRTDRQVVSFTKDYHQPDTLPSVMKSGQQNYIREMIERTFDFDLLVREIQNIQGGDTNDPEVLPEESTMPVLKQIAASLSAERNNTVVFRRQLISYLTADDQTPLLKRIKDGSDYYKKILQQQIYVLLYHIEETKQRKRIKTYAAELSDLDQLFFKKVEEIDKMVYLTQSILAGHYQFDFSDLHQQRLDERNKMLDDIRNKIKLSPVKKDKSKRRGKAGARKNKKDAESTYDITLKLLEAGMSADDIAKERALALSTIEGHLSKAVQSGRLEIGSYISQDALLLITETISGMPDGFTSKDLFQKLDGRFSYHQLRAAMDVVKRST